MVFVLENNQYAYSTPLDKFETTLRDSSVFLDAEIRRLSGRLTGTIGVQLAEQAFAASKGKDFEPGTSAWSTCRPNQPVVTLSAYGARGQRHIGVHAQTLGKHVFNAFRVRARPDNRAADWPK